MGSVFFRVEDERWWGVCKCFVFPFSFLVGVSIAKVVDNLNGGIVGLALLIGVGLHLSRLNINGGAVFVGASNVKVVIVDNLHGGNVEWW